MTRSQGSQDFILSSRSKQILNIGFILTILFIVFGSSLNFVLKIFPDSQSTENRPIKQFSAESRAQLNSIPNLVDFISTFPTNFDIYFQDRFSLRNKVIQNYYEFKYYNFSETSEKGLKGQDGWLYNRIPDIFDHKNYCDSFDLLPSFKTFFQQNKQYLESRSMSYYVFVAPNKETIYPEFVPKSMSKDLCGQSRLEKLQKSFNSDDTVKIVFPKDELIAAKNDKQLFYKTDNHWNADAAYIASQKLFKTIKESDPGLKIPTLENFIIYKDPLNDYISGDLARVMSLPKVSEQASSFNSYKPKSNPSMNYESLDKNLRPDGKFYTYVPYHLPPPSRFKILNPNALNQKKVLVIQDSFSAATVPFFNETFSEVDFVFIQDSVDFKNQIVDTLKPDLVIHQFLEKKL